MNPPMPTIPFGQHRVSRLIIGGNPFSGNSHVCDELSREMRDYFTTETIKKTLRDCEAAGINTIQARGDAHIARVLNEFRNEGGNLQWIAQTASELADQKRHIRSLASLGAIGVYHHGSRTDNFWHEGRIGEVAEYLKIMRDAGVSVGLGTHIPEVIAHAEERGWDVDFYMACVYNLNRRKRESAIVAGPGADAGSEKFFVEDRDRMLATIRATPKTCLAFKILAAGRHCATPETTREAVHYALAGIKPTDAIVVGMFPKFRDQVAENARWVTEFDALQ
ncbi:MAG TPA: hypothetical protein PL033_09380 [Candidatus Brocadiia bacterium]|nr:hypothetical protein [Candidatus Brocadiia bacterium]